jgi:hypothetical protein
MSWKNADPERFGSLTRMECLCPTSGTSTISVSFTCRYRGIPVSQHEGQVPRGQPPQDTWPGAPTYVQLPRTFRSIMYIAVFLCNF